jgi:elongation factor Ts
MAITAAQVKELRERTGLGMMDCKKALQEANGDLDLAIDTLRKSSALKAAKKAGRTTAEGLLGVQVSDDGRKGAMVEVNIETDFAAKNEKFIGFVAEVLSATLAAETDDIKKIMAQGLDAKRETLVQEIGENVTVRRAAFVGSADGQVQSYLHSDQRKGALVELSGDGGELGRDIAMHITGSDPAPLVVAGDQLDPALVAKEREIFTAQAADSGKPPEIVEKMIEGRVRKYLAEVSLLDQPFVKDSSSKVGALLKDKGLDCRSFVRFVVGDGIEVDTTDFASEVAAQVKGAS